MTSLNKRRLLHETDLRPSKLQRLDSIGETGGPANLGTSLENPIILDDDDEEYGIEFAFNVGRSMFDSLVGVDLFGNPPVQLATPSPGSASDGIIELVTSPTQLFYHDTGRGLKTPAARSLPVITRDQRSGKAKQKQMLQLSSGWPSFKDNRLLNVYLEGEHFANSILDRHSHLHLPQNGVPDLDTLQIRDVRQELARLLDVDDPMSLQLEIQYVKAYANAAIFGQGICKRFNAAWDNTSVDDRQTLSKALKSQDSWLRVRIADYIWVDIEAGDVSFAFTPSARATMSQIRQLIASVVDTTAGAIRMFVDDIELVDEMGKLSFMAFDSGSRIRAITETRECVNCLDDAGFRDFPFEPTTEECSHDLDICKKCIATWITTSLDNGNWKNITCVAANCGAVLQYNDVKRAAADADMQRYERFSTRDALSSMPGFKWCLAPDCDGGQIHDDGGGTEQILTCQFCGFKRCTACDRAWHQDETCEQYTARLAAQPADHDASEAWVANNSRKCPGCQSPIQKNDGCDHMTCTRCRRQFCWLCSADYTDIHRDGNTAHAQHCRYHSGNIPDPHAPNHAVPMARMVFPAARRGRAAFRRAAADQPNVQQAVAQPVPQPVPMQDIQAHPQPQAQPVNYFAAFGPNWTPREFVPAPVPAIPAAMPVIPGASFMPQKAQNLNHAQDFHPMQVLQAWQPMQAMESMRPTQSIQPMQPMQPVQHMAPMQSMQHRYPGRHMQPAQPVQLMQPLQAVQDPQIALPPPQVDPTFTNIAENSQHRGVQNSGWLAQYNQQYNDLIQQDPGMEFYNQAFEAPPAYQP